MPYKKRTGKLGQKKKPYRSKIRGRSPQKVFSIAHKPGYVVAIIVNILLLSIFNNILSWNVPFLTSEFSEVLPAINISIIVTIIANVIFIFYDRNWIQAPLRFILSLIGVYVMYVVFVVFPFDFSFASTSIPIALFARISLIIGIVATLIGAFTELIKRSTHPNEN